MPIALQSLFAATTLLLALCSPSNALKTVTLTTTKTVTTTPTSHKFAPFCTAVAVPNVGTYTQFYSGGSYIEATNNPGEFGNKPHVTVGFPGTYSQCQAAQACANKAGAAGVDENNVYFSFDLHFLKSKGAWVCVYYFDTNTNGTYFNVLNFDAAVSYGFNCPYF